MTRSARILSILCGYAAAALAAFVAIWWRQQHTSGPAAQASAGMSAFGDALLGIIAFALVASVPTMLGLVFLRSVPGFWKVASVVSLVAGATGPVAGWILSSMTPRSAPHTAGTLATVVALRMFAVPVLLGYDALLAVFAPARAPRWRFIFAAALEAVTATLALVR